MFVCCSSFVVCLVVPFLVLFLSFVSCVLVFKMQLDRESAIEVYYGSFHLIKTMISTFLSPNNEYIYMIMFGVSDLFP